MDRNYHVILINGDSLNFKTIFDQYFNSLVLFADRFLGCREESESVVQDAFMALWENRREFPDEVSVKAYLYSITRNKALNVLKHRKVVDEHCNEMLREENSEAYYMESVIEEETRRLVFTAVEALPEACRRVCLLNLDGWNNQEVADQLKISLDMVKFHKKNAYKILREKLRGHFYCLFLV